jgi:hypothetical protein
VTACAAASPTPSTRPAAPARRRAARAGCSGRRSRVRPAGASGRGRSRRSAAATSHGPARPGRPDGPAAAGRARRGRPPTTGGGVRSTVAVRPTAWRSARRRGPLKTRGPRAEPPAPDPPLGGCRSPDRPRWQGLMILRSGHDHARRSAVVHPQPWGQVVPKGLRQTVYEGRRTVVCRAHHQCEQSYPQYPQPCPQTAAIMLGALTWEFRRAMPRRRRSGRRSPRIGHRRARPARRRPQPR